jgi:hypothetical protein
MRHMEIQCGKEGMKTAKFNANMGATAGCTIRLLLNSIPQEEAPYEAMLGLAVLTLQMRLAFMGTREFSKLNSTILYFPKNS